MFPNFSVNTGFGLSVPYTTPVNNLQPGTQIQVVGTPTGNRFEVNLKNYQDDFVLHLNPRFDANKVVLNTAQRGAWGAEEQHPLHFYRGVRFTLNITVTHSGFSITVNNARVGEFRQRVPLYSAQVLEVKGDIQLESAQVFSGGFGGGMGSFPGMNVTVNPGGFGMGGMGGMGMGGMNVNFGFPSAPPSVPTPSFGMGGGVPSIHSCHIHVGSRIFVRGYIHPNANRFELNLLQGFNDTDDVAFHFNPRFDQRQIVKNHRRHGSWGSEENQPFPAFMPLVPGAQIDLQIACLPDRYTVYMNNHLIAEYSHKIPPGAVMALQYKGDITVQSVGQL